MKMIAFVALVILIISPAYAQDVEVPQHYVMKTGEDYARYEADMVRCFNWLMTVPVDQELEKRMDAGAFILTWAQGSPVAKIEVREKIVTFAEANTDLTLIFVGGWAKYSVESRDSSKVNGNIKGIESVIEFYQRHRAKLQKDKYVERYMKMKENGTLEEFIKKNV